jgi:putative transposase
MKKSKFTEEQIAYALRQVESGTPPADVCRQLGVSEATFYIETLLRSGGTSPSMFSSHPNTVKRMLAAALMDHQRHNWRGFD